MSHFSSKQNKKRELLIVRNRQQLLVAGSK